MSARLKLLDQYCRNHFPKWREEYGENLVGVHVGKKIQNGNEKLRYSIVFQVENKVTNPDHPIPKEIEVELNQRKSLIKTDVIQTGKPQLSLLSTGDKARHVMMNDSGALGLILRRNNYYYICSNMHVLGEPILQNGFNSYYCDITQQFQVDTMFYSGGQTGYGFLEQGLYGDIDVAISRVADPSILDVQIPGFGYHNGIKIFSYQDYQDYPVVIIGSQSGPKYTNVRRINSLLYLEYYGLPTTFTDLICTDHVTQRGDSGSMVLDYNTRRIVGIVVAGDAMFTYIIPIWRILNFFNATLT